MFEDWHSFVCQYVVKIQPSEELKHELYENNINIIDINENNAPYYIKSYREYVLSTIGDTCENKIFRISCEYEQKMVNMSNYYEQRIIDYENKIRSLHSHPQSPFIGKFPAHHPHTGPFQHEWRDYLFVGLQDAPFAF